MTGRDGWPGDGLESKALEKSGILLGWLASVAVRGTGSAAPQVLEAACQMMCFFYLEEIRQGAERR